MRGAPTITLQKVKARARSTLTIAFLAASANAQSSDEYRAVPLVTRRAAGYDILAFS
jgi:hypothetical protein